MVAVVDVVIRKALCLIQLFRQQHTQSNVHDVVRLPVNIYGNQSQTVFGGQRVHRRSQTAGGKQRQAIEVDKSGAICGETSPSKDQDARWTKKNGKFKLGYKQHTRTDSDGYIEKLHISPANAHECNHFEPLLSGLAPETTVYADKGYDSKANREHLQSKQLSDGIMRKAKRGQSLSAQEKQRNKELSKTRYVVEQSFGTLHRKFRYARASYFGLLKVAAQSHLKAICLNLLKAANRLSVPVAA